MSSSDAPSAAVRTITPPSFTSRRLRMSLRRLRSSSSSRRETPRPSPCGTRTTKRPGSEIWVVRRAPFVFIGSLTAWTRMRLAALDQILDLAAVALLELRADDLVDVEEAVLLEADLDERRLHAGQDVVDEAEVDVARDRTALGPLEIDLGDLRVLEDRDAALADVDRHEQLALRGGQRRAARRLAAAARWDWSRRRSCRCESSRRCGCFGSAFSFRSGVAPPCGGAGGRAGLLAAPAPAAAAAAALRLGRIGRLGIGRTRRPVGQLRFGLRLELGCVRRVGRRKIFFRKRNQGK